MCILTWEKNCVFLVAYSTMKPEFCIISNKPYSNRNDPDFRELILVKDG